MLVVRILGCIWMAWNVWVGITVALKARKEGKMDLFRGHIVSLIFHIAIIALLIVL